LGINRSLPRYLPDAEVRHGRAGVEALLRDVIAVKGALAGFTVILLNLFSAPVFSALGLGPAHRLWIWLVSGIYVCEALREIALRVLSSYFRQKLINGTELATLLVHPFAAALILWLGFGVSGAMAVNGALSFAGAVVLGSRRAA
jgi:hypothetical protein